MKICVDFTKCTGLGICESFAPEVFEVNDEGDLVLLAEEVDDSMADVISQAIDGCPTEAISRGD